MASRGGLGCKAIDVKEPRLKRPSDVRFENERTARSVQHTQAPHCARPTVDGADLKPHSVNPSQSARPSSLLELQRYDPRYPGLLLQPDSRPISQEQLASEVKSIYAGLTIVETKCIHVDRAQAQVAANTNSQLGSEHWQALIALHRTLLHEHHDFFLAFQHASASPALRRLAKKYSMPARMWKHGIHSFLELLRQRIPDSIDYMLAFIYLAYQMMALLYETVPEFEDTWIECLGDLSRYRITIEDEDIRDRETWAGVARSWYTKAADKNPTVGRLYHHLAILARPNAIQQLYYYARSLTCVRPFPSARESILTLLDPILGRAVASYSHALPIDTSFNQAHALLFERSKCEDFEGTWAQFQSQLDSHIGRVTVKWKEQGVYIAVTNVAGLFDFGVDGRALRSLLLKDDDLQKNSFLKEPGYGEVLAHNSQSRLCKAFGLNTSTLSVLLRRTKGKNGLPHLHVLLAFVSAFTNPILTLISGLSMLPIATASPLFHPQALSVEGKRTIYSDDSIGDWIISGTVLVYLVLAYGLDPKTRKLSLAGSVISATFWVAMVSEGDRPEFPSNYRWNILKTWAATTVALTCQAIKSSIETANHGVSAPLNSSRSESITHRFLFQLFATFALIQVTGMAIQGFGNGSFLNAVPPCLSIAVLTTSRLSQKLNQYPRFAAECTPSDSVPADSAPNSVRARSFPQEPPNASLPCPSHFALTEDETDLESLAGT
ncbi:hypothetical protein IQ06DRAFT_107036 [Phaeosphaeriaceae sp. SRC1lsM3a]|nr:hypothetical protein IQ06DRAFT_107036 [Stagonospora sp. SRC1lsM3a]